MKKNILIFIMATTELCSCGQCSKLTPETLGKETINSVRKYEYADSMGKLVIIENGFPKGGMKYIDPNGDSYNYIVFWTRIINETDHTLELKMNVPADSYELPSLPGKYYNVLIPTDTMTVEKIPLVNYGLTGLESFLDNNIHKSSSLKRIINPKESSGFYVLMLSLIEGSSDFLRTGLSLKGQELFYRISRYTPTPPTLSLVYEKDIHFGSINLKNLIFQK